MEVNTSSILEEFLCTVSFVPPSLQVSCKLRMLQLTCFFTPPSHFSKSISPFDHMAAGTHLLTHTAVLQVTVLNTCCTRELCNIIWGYRATNPPTLPHFSQCNSGFGPTQSLASFQREATLPLLHLSELSNQEYRGNFCSFALGVSRQAAHTVQQHEGQVMWGHASRVHIPLLGYEHFRYDWLCSGDWNINSNFWEEWLHPNTPPS